MKTYTFRVVVEPDEDRWFAYCPALRDYGAATWGYTREEALQHINEVVQMVISELREDGGSSGSHQRFQHADGRRVTVSFHKPSDTFAPKTLKSIITQAGWSEEDLRRLKLIH
jgi:predicted RNA binding protein YcfA (HicA-like mRNA interferase family)